jgi:hypothetical protein
VHDAPDARVSSLLSAFATLSSPQQATLLEMLNRYMFASPAQRRRLRQQWACACQAADRRSLDSVAPR